MPNHNSFAAGDYVWHIKRVTIPRVGLWLDRNGIHNRLILPGRYLVKRSRTLRRKLYRSDHS